jgi:hypothetical protein
VDDRNAEDGHHRVADELLHDALVAFDDGLHLVEVAPHHAAERFGVEPLPERGGAGHVGKDDRDGLSGFARRRGGFELRAASTAETESLGVLLTAAGARNHAA